MNAPFFFAADAAFRLAFPHVKGRLILAAIFLAILAALFPSPARAQLYTESNTLAGAANPGEYFGYHVAASGDTIVVGTSSNKRVYVFVRSGSGWVLQQQFTANYHDQTEGFIAVHGDTLVAGGIIFTRSGGVWTEQQALPVENDDPRFALQGDTLLVGDPYPVQPSQNQDGNAKVYVRNGSTWTQQASLQPDVFLSRENMGYSVALDGDTALVGIFAQSQGPGGAYVFVRNGTTWSRQTRLVLPTGASWMRVAIEGNTAAIGDPGNNKIHIFDRTGTTWALTQTLTLPAGGGNFLGDEIAMSGGIIAASAEGQFHLYSRTPTGWIHAQTLSWPGNNFPSLALANRGKLLVTGNPFENRNGLSAAGLVRVNSVPPPPAPGSGWRSSDIGAVGVAGSSTDNGTTVTVRGSGADIWERSDAFHFRSESLTGDGAIIARVDSAGSGHPWSKVGLMFREDIAPSSRNVMNFVTPGSHLGTQGRLATGDTTAYQDAGWHSAPIWLMLVRSGNLFASYRSHDGDSWTPIGSYTVEMAPTVHVGLAVSSHHNAVLNTGTFSQVEIVGNEPPPPPPGIAAPSELTGNLVDGTNVRLIWNDNSDNEDSFVIERSLGNGTGTFTQIAAVGGQSRECRVEGLADNTTYTFRVRARRGSETSPASNPFTITTTTSHASMVGTNLGTVAIPGSFTYNSGTFTIDAAGADIWNAQDSGYFIHRELNGDFDIRARVASLTNTHPWAKAGIMVRETEADARAANVFTLVTGDNAAGMQVRTATGASTTFTSGPWVRAPYWVRLVRRGNRFESFVSPDGATWQSVGVVTFALRTRVRAGLAVSSHVDNTRTRAVITNLQFGP